MAKSKVEEVEETMAVIEVPICAKEDIVGPIVGLRVDCRLKPGHQVTLARVRTELSARHATLADGRHVESVTDVVRWLLEQVELAA